jgi:hypothetical protein
VSQRALLGHEEDITCVNDPVKIEIKVVWRGRQRGEMKREQEIGAPNSGMLFSSINCDVKG